MIYWTIVFIVCTLAGAFVLGAEVQYVTSLKAERTQRINESHKEGDAKKDKEICDYYEAKIARARTNYALPILCILSCATSLLISINANILNSLDDYREGRIYRQEIVKAKILDGRIVECDTTYKYKLFKLPEITEEE